MKSIRFEVELRLQLPNDARYVHAMRRSIGHHLDRPIRAALVARIHPHHAAALHVCELAAKVRNFFVNTCEQQFLKLLGGAGWLCHPAIM